MPRESEIIPQEHAQKPGWEQLSVAEVLPGGREVLPGGREVLPGGPKAHDPPPKCTPEQGQAPRDGFPKGRSSEGTV